MATMSSSLLCKRLCVKPVKVGLQSGLSAEEQYRQLMDAGISVTKSQSIVLGRGLTEAEQKNLKEDVVLLVSKSVVLPNGKTGDCTSTDSVFSTRYKASERVALIYKLNPLTFLLILCIIVVVLWRTRM